MLTNQKFIVLDSETDGLAYDCTKIWILGWTEDGKTYNTTTNYDEMRELLSQDALFVCHNGVQFDMVVFNRILDLNLTYKKFVDTLALSWYLFPDRAKHGLESWGDTVGVKKVAVDNEQWAEGDTELMKSRVSEDVKINWKVWELMRKRLEEIYG